MFSRFTISAALLGALGLGAAGGATFSNERLAGFREQVVFLEQFCSEAELAPTFARVSRVVDGDTFKLESGESVRLLGPDTPEICHKNRRGEIAEGCVDEPFGRAAADFLKNKIDGKEVVLLGEPLEGPRDYFGRELRYLFVGDENIGLSIVSEGLAPVYARLKKDSRFYDDLQAAESEARAKKRGLWGDAAAMEALGLSEK